MTFELVYSDEVATAEKHNRIHGQLKRYGQVPYIMAASISLGAIIGALSSDIGHTYGTRNYGEGTYSGSVYEAGAQIGISVNPISPSIDTGHTYGTRNWGEGTYGS